MLNQRKKFINKLEDFLNNTPEYLLSLTNVGFYNFPPGKRNIKVTFVHLQAECLIELRETQTGYNVLVDDEYANKLDQLGYNGWKYECLMALFFFHELYHLEQNIGHKHTIRGFRHFGYVGEFMVAMMDVKADRVSVLGTKRFLPDLLENTIARVQSESLEDFPSIKNQPAESLWRKNRRFVANRLQHLAIKNGFYQPLLENVHNFLFATWNPSTEQGYFDFSLSMCGAEMQYLGMARISEEEFKFLDDITFECESSVLKFKVLDRMLLEIIDRLHFGNSTGLISRFG